MRHTLPPKIASHQKKPASLPVIKFAMGDCGDSTASELAFQCCLQWPCRWFLCRSWDNEDLALA